MFQIILKVEIIINFIHNIDIYINNKCKSQILNFTILTIA